IALPRRLIYRAPPRLHQELQPDNIVARGVPPTVVSKPQERERLRFSLSTLLPVRLGKAPKLNQPRLLRMKFQSELGQPFPKLSQEPLGVVLMLESQHEIVGIADDYHVAPGHFPAPDLCPQVEHIV